MWLLEHDYDVRVIIGDLTYDEPVVRDLRAWLETRSIAEYRDRIEDEPAASVDQIIEQISDVDLVVASRFHNVLLSLLIGRPVVSISYNEKNDALMTDVGLAAYCQTVDRFEVPRLIEQLRSLENDAAALLESVAAKVATYRRELQGQYEILFQILGASRRGAR
jgi:polysaccharide pyruvyl transferase WcaK-like protein